MTGRPEANSILYSMSFITVRELISILRDQPQHVPVQIVAANMGQGCDTYAPITEVRLGSHGVMLGAKDMLCSQSPNDWSRQEDGASCNNPFQSKS